MAPPADSVRLSAALVVQDDADVLMETLQSMQAIADEIVVVDAGSTDGTLAIARQAGARVFSHPWNDDFAAARNACLHHARGDWILWLEAGEQLLPADACQLRRHVEHCTEVWRAYAVLVEVPPEVLGASAEQIACVRLTPKHARLRFQGRVRESLLPSLSALSIPLDALPIRLRRHPRDQQPPRKVARARLNLRLAELDLQERGAQPHLFNCVGEACQTLEDYRRAECFYRLALQVADPGSVEMLEAYYGVITSLEYLTDRRAEQQAVCLQALEVFPLDVQLLCAMGGYLQRQGQMQLAAQAYQTAHEHGQVQPWLWYVSNVHELAAACFSRILNRLGRSTEAMQVLTEALAQYPDSACLRVLANMQAACGEPPTPSSSSPAPTSALHAWPGGQPGMETSHES